MEPLALAIRSSANIQGFQRASGVEKIALYVEDAMDIIVDFGWISGLIINWDKLKLLPVDSLESGLPSGISRFG